MIVKCYRKTLWLLPKTKQGKSRDESQISSPASILVFFFFSKIPVCNGKGGCSQEPPSHHANVQMVTRHRMQPCVLKCTRLQRVASRLSGSQTLYTTAPNKPHSPVHGIQPCIPAHVTENHLNPRASKDPKSLVYI